MTDSEWLEAVCGKVRSRLGDTRAYDADALLYRKINTDRLEFKAKVQKHLDVIGYDGGGAFTRLIWNICNVAHPKDWRVCESCNGTDQGSDGSSCQKCFPGGCGYRLTWA